MKFLRSASSSLLAAAIVSVNWIPLVSSFHSSDTITSCGDNTRACYETNHNMDPAVVSSSSFGQLWRTALPGNYRNAKEQMFAQPLVFTPSGGTTQYVYVSTTQNKVYKIDAKTGAIVAERALAIPFLTADLDGCLDVNPLVGNTATGVIDPETETWYLTIKTYRDQTDVEKGRLNGRYFVYAIDTTTLADRPNFPVPLEDLPARNNPKRWFKGGNQHQRPALLQHGSYIYAGFASHCVQYNFTGWLVGWEKTSGKIVESYSMQGGPEGLNVKGGGIWMSGGGIASDNKGSMWFATGNGYASQLHGTPVPGRQPPSALEEAAVHATIQEDGTIRVVDFFMPYEKEALDGADQDLGTSPLILSPFSCPNAARIGIITGKNGKTYFLNMDNLGGYCMSPTKQDAILGVYQHENSVYSGAGVYPLSSSSGYVYINVIQYPTRVFQFSCNAAGNPQFVPVAQSTEKNAYVLGVGHGTTTSFPGKQNSALLWVSDVQGFNLRIYRATPESGVIQTLKTFNVPGVTKFQKPVFGNGIAFVGTNQGYLYAFGSPVNSPLECSDPYDFGNQNIGTESSAKTISCKAKIGLQVTGASLSSNTNFKLVSVPSFPAAIAQGANFTFTASFAPGSVGSLTTDVYLNTTNQVPGYSTQVAISLAGNGKSANALLAVRPETVTFAGYITGSSSTGVDQTFVIANDGDTALTISGYQFSTTSATGPWVNPTVSGNTQKVDPFTFFDLPTAVAANTQQDVKINFYTTKSGTYKVYLKVNSNVGSKTVAILATSADPPKAVVEFQKPDLSGWVPFDPNVPFSFGDVLQQQTLNLKLRITNNGGANAASLSITVSKPPVGSDSIVGAVNGVDLGEGTLIASGKSEEAVLYCSVPRTQVNTDPYKGSAVWTMNINDPSFGKQTFHFDCNAIAQQYGPKKNETEGLYRYIGCAKENNPTRQLQTQLWSKKDNDNKMCIEACFAAGWTFAGTQYLSECWCGNTVPREISLERDCNYGCAASDAFTCGGNGYFGGGAFISLFARSDKYVPGQQPTGTATTTEDTPTPTPTETANPEKYKGFVHKGCYSQPGGARALPNLVAANSSMTIELCIDAAIQRGFTHCGVEYGQECWGGPSIRSESAELPITQCSFPCPGNPNEKCGAGSKFNYYRLEDEVVPSEGEPTTTTSATSSTTTTTSKTTSSTTTTMTSTTTTTTSSSTTTAATTTSSTTTTTTTASITTTSSTTTSTTTTTTTSRSTTSSTTSSTTTTTTTTSSRSTTTMTTTTRPPTTTSASATPVNPSTVGAFTTMGCYKEPTGVRAIPNKLFGNDTMTIEQCATNCAPYKFFGVEYGRECWCGNVLNVEPNGGRAPETDCKTKCKGNSTQICGGSSRLNAYQKKETN